MGLVSKIKIQAEKNQQCFKKKLEEFNADRKTDYNFKDFRTTNLNF